MQPRLVLGLCAVCVLVLVRSGWAAASAAEPCGTVYWKGPEQVAFVPGPVDKDEGAAWGCFYDEISTSGWSRLYVNAQPSSLGDVISPKDAVFSDEDRMYCAGYLEAVLTHTRIHDYYSNFFVSSFGANGTVPENVTKFLLDQLNWVRQQAKEHAATDDYWAHVGFVVSQWDGLKAGFDFACEGGECDDDPYLLVMAGDLEDIMAWNELRSGVGDLSALRIRMKGFDSAGMHDPELMAGLLHSCSALVRVTNETLFAGHSLFTGYSNMVRVFKYYDLPLTHPATNARGAMFASKPADFTSKDDYYVLDSGLVVLETSLTIFNDSLVALISPETVPSWIREVVSNRMAAGGRDWTAQFAKFHSGSHNAQWIVFDTRQFAPGNDLPSDMLWVLEEIPGQTESRDETSRLASEGYYAGYNIPSFEAISEASGTSELVKRFGHWFSYTDCPRARIFARDAPCIESFDDFKHFMQSNHWETDPLSEGYPVNAICARYDLIPLEPVTLPPMAYGCAGSEATSLDLLREMRSAAVSGPGHESQPVFEYSGRFANVPHAGQPERWNFDWVMMAPDDEY